MRSKLGIWRKGGEGKRTGKGKRWMKGRMKGRRRGRRWGRGEGRRKYNNIIYYYGVWGLSK